MNEWLTLGTGVALLVAGYIWGRRVGYRDAIGRINSSYRAMQRVQRYLGPYLTDWQKDRIRESFDLDLNRGVVPSPYESHYEGQLGSDADRIREYAYERSRPDAVILSAESDAHAFAQARDEFVRMRRHLKIDEPLDPARIECTKRPDKWVQHWEFVVLPPEEST
jgi:hypothetical protein